MERGDLRIDGVAHNRRSKFGTLDSGDFILDSELETRRNSEIAFSKLKCRQYDVYTAGKASEFNPKDLQKGSFGFFS